MEEEAIFRQELSSDELELLFTSEITTDLLADRFTPCSFPPPKRIGLSKNVLLYEPLI